MNIAIQTLPGRRAHILLEPGNKIAMNGHVGTVTERRPEGYLILWDKFVDRETGEVFSEAVRTLPHEEVEQADRIGRLNVLNAPGAMTKSTRPSRFDRSVYELRRMQFRKAYVVAADELINSGEMGRSREGFWKNLSRITAAGAKLDDE